MTLLLCESFDHYGAGGTTSQTEFEFVWGYGDIPSYSLHSGQGRNGTVAWSPYAGATGYDDRYESGRFLPSTYSTIIFGAAIRFTMIPTSATPLIHFGDGGSLQVGIWANTNATYYVRRGDGTNLGSSTFTFSIGAWNYIEAKFIIDGTNGGAWVKANGNTIINLGAYAGSPPGSSPVGLDTTNTANNYANTIWLGGGQAVDHRNATTKYIDDLYVCDTSGSVNNDFLGDVTVQLLNPNGVGNYSGWTPTAGSNYTNVNESTPNDTNFVSTTSSDTRDSYAFANLSGTNTIYAVQQLTKIKKTTSGTRTVRQFSRLSSTDADLGDARAVPGGYILFWDIAETKPGGGGWTNTDVNDAEFGIRTVT